MARIKNWDNKFWGGYGEIGSMKINKRKSTLQWSLEMGSWRLTGRDGCGYYFTMPAAGRKPFLVPQQQPCQSETVKLSQWEPILQTAFTSTDFFVYNSPSQLPLFFYKRASLSFVLAYGSVIACMSWIAVLCCSQVNLFLAGKITGDFIFKVNRYTASGNVTRSICFGKQSCGSSID